ncbi:MAG: hypothetical protein K2J38_02450 [Muribaculaceae bacterium]|nr:hypothetical protein [Muribaculaceae bacterium]
MPANNNKFPQNEYFYPPVAESSRLLIGCSREDYSASRIARAVEDCDAHLLNLNITARPDKADGEDGETFGVPFQYLVDIRVSHRNASGVKRSLERYGYDVLDILSAEHSEDSEMMRKRIDELFRYLEI